MASVLLPWSLRSAQPPEKQPDKAPVPKAAFVLLDRHGHATPERAGTSHTGAGNTDVAQPRDDTVVVTMTGVAVAGPHPCKASAAAMDFEFNQSFEIAFSDSKLKKARLTMEASIIGLLRGDKDGGSAGVSHGGATIAVGPMVVLGVALEGHAVAGCENLSINDHKGPVSVQARAGAYHLQQTFHINASHVRSICGKAAAAAFAPGSKRARPGMDQLYRAVPWRCQERVRLPGHPACRAGLGRTLPVLRAGSVSDGLASRS